jgi:uncharacterized membrane protein YhaH (DUF805 family)
MQWYLKVISNYVGFAGRARRKEYWMFMLVNILIALTLGFVEGLLGSPGYIGGLYSLFIMLPSIAVAVRRLHDTGRTGWWVLINFVPFIGFFIFLYFMVVEGEPSDNEYGRDPIVD